MEGGSGPHPLPGTLLEVGPLRHFIKEQFHKLSSQLTSFYPIRSEFDLIVLVHDAIP
jgi:hypothetical protein